MGGAAASPDDLNPKAISWSGGRASQSKARAIVSTAFFKRITTLASVKAVLAALVDPLLIFGEDCNVKRYVLFKFALIKVTCYASCIQGEKGNVNCVIHVGQEYLLQFSSFLRCR